MCSPRTKLVMVSGAFDPLHPGHLRYFKAAQAYGHALLVAIDSDEFVAAKHPLMLTAVDRMAIIDELRCVDVTEIASGPDVCDIIRSYLPDVYCVGPDHAPTGDAPSFPEKALCEELGVKIVYLEDDSKMSSTALIEKVQRK